ncbi:MAG: glycosyltransferase [Fusobacterium gastrosuis]|uniref:glycosyltransferase n=1 Tax=Fusobacterium gastrosuis TaxID=1755100 RepID=UPI002A9459F7|nr:glycosyltransferase [Fusobacterium gastrosuis]
MKPKILFYTLSTHLGGGIETVTIEYVNDFIKNGYEVDLLVDYNMGNNEKSIEKDIDKKVNVQYLKSVKLSKLIYYFRNKGQKNKIYNLFLYASIILSDFFLWRKEIKKLRKNDYVATITFFQYLPAYITKIKGAKHFIFLHGSVEHFFQGIRKYFKKLFFKKLNKFDYVCTVSEEMLNQLREVFPKLTNKQETIYNPFDYKKIKEKAKDYSELSKEEKELITKPYICSVGRINEGQKDFTTLINSYKKLVDGNKIEENLVIVGDGPDLELLEEYVKKLKLDQRIFFLGRKNNPYVWIDNCKLFVLSTKFEGFGLVLTESMLLNKKVISSNCLVGPKEILENGKYGKLFEIGNIEELSKKILITLSEEEKETEEYVIKKFNTGFKRLLGLIEE